MDLTKILTLPTEVQLIILHYVVNRPGRLAALTEASQELADVFRFDAANFIPKLKIIVPHASQLDRIVATTIMLTDGQPAKPMADFLEESLHLDPAPFGVPDYFDSAKWFQTYCTLRKEADILVEMYAHSILSAAYTYVTSGILEGTETFSWTDLSTVELHRIERAFLRLQLYSELSDLWPWRRRRSKKLRSFFKILTPAEVEELRSVVEWLKHEYALCNSPDPFVQTRVTASLLEQSLVRRLFDRSGRHHHANITLFEHEVLPFLRICAAPYQDRPRKSRLRKLPKKWADSPTDIGRPMDSVQLADDPRLPFPGLEGHRYSRRVYHEVYLRYGYVFWSNTTLGSKNFPRMTRYFKSKLSKQYRQIYESDWPWEDCWA